MERQEVGYGSESKNYHEHADSQERDPPQVGAQNRAGRLLGFDFGPHCFDGGHFFGRFGVDAHPRVKRADAPHEKGAGEDRHKHDAHARIPDRIEVLQAAHHDHQQRAQQKAFNAHRDGPRNARLARHQRAQAEQPQSPQEGQQADWDGEHQHWPPIHRRFQVLQRAQRDDQRQRRYRRRDADNHRATNSL